MAMTTGWYLMKYDVFQLDIGIYKYKARLGYDKDIKINIMTVQV